MVQENISPGYVLPRDFMYFRVFFRPIREAFFLTASVGRPSDAATSAVGRLGNSLRNDWTSFLDHVPLVSFLLAISRVLSFRTIMD